MIIPSHLKMSADGLMRAILQQKRKMGIKRRLCRKGNSPTNRYSSLPGQMINGIPEDIYLKYMTMEQQLPEVDHEHYRK